ncbi:hypothetical protein HX024_13405 [Myroides marinus]|uniref:hypothetical protein n=1 Tax=Myroides marinus TaxID=703342 RepID=UPI00257512F0|nr:hypothetical protein [Myroides marinus]MDM1383678.1 hypothetical protein [Myroides marinus]
MRRVISALMLFYSFVAIAQVGIGLEDPKAAVHIAKEVKLKDVRNVEGAMTDYPKHLIADEKGNLAVFTGLPTDLIFKNVLTKKMEQYVMIDKNDVKDNKYSEYTETSLDLNTTLTVPAHRTYVLEITYSIPSLYAGSGNPKGEFGVFIKRKLGAKPFEKINQSVNVFSSPLASATTTTAKGRAIGYTYIDTVSNETDTPLELQYDLYGFTEFINLSNYEVRFGSYTNSGTNYNWGKGVILLTINELIK